MPGLLQPLQMIEQSAPSTPPTGHVYVYAKSDGLVYIKDDAGTESALGGGITQAATGNVSAGNALTSLTTGSYNTAFGDISADAITEGTSNSAFGGNSLGGVTTGNNNTALGYSAGAVIQSGGYNTILGAGADVTAEGDTLGIAIGANAIVPGSNQGVLGGDGTDAVYMGVCAGQSTTYAKIGGTLFEDFTSEGNVSTTETDLFSNSIPAETLFTNGDKLEACYGGTFLNHATATRQLKVYFAGTAVFDSGALTISTGVSAWMVRVLLIRVSSTVARVVVSMTVENAANQAYTQYAEVTSLDFTASNILKVTGTAAATGAATDDIIGKLGTVYWMPKA